MASKIYLIDLSIYLIQFRNTKFLADAIVQSICSYKEKFIFGNEKTLFQTNIELFLRKNKRWLTHSHYSVYLKKL